MLEYESGLLRAEFEYCTLVAQRAPGVPVPVVLRHGEDAVLGQWLFTEALPGTALATLRERDPHLDDALVRHQLGGCIAALHCGSGNRFGYSGTRPHAGTWPAAFTAIVETLLRDAVAWQVELGDAPRRIRRAVAWQTSALEDVRRPALLHWDLWDGNVLAAGDDGPLRLTGLVDGERYLYGDPLMDLVSPALFRRIEDEPAHPFVAGYAEAGGADSLVAASAHSRLSLYRMHLYLLMLVEMPSRGDIGPEHEERRAFLSGLLAKPGSTVR